MSATRRRLALSLLVGSLLAVPSAAQAGTTARPFGVLDCVPSGVARICEGSAPLAPAEFGGPADRRVRSTADTGSVPLDVNVALPATSSGPLPLVVLLHGWGGRKYDAAGMVGRAARGYAVLSPTARGWYGSCGLPAVRVADPMGCAKGWTHINDTRFEARDVQHLIGVLVDEGIVDPARIGVTGASYGGGMSTTLAVLNDRSMLPSGRLIPWRSPAGRPLHIAAAVPEVPWTDLAYSLTPNGHALDYAITPRSALLDPPGVMKLSYNLALYGTGAGSAYYAPKGVDPTADLTGWLETFQAGEPYTSARARAAGDQASRYHSAYALLDAAARRPAPMLMSNGWTDDLFPVDEAVRFGNRLRERYPTAVFGLLPFDWGHPRGANKTADTRRLGARVDAWFDHYLKGTGTAPFAGVEAYTQTCPASAPSGGPFRAAWWPALHPGEVRLTSAGTRTLSSGGRDAAAERAFNPIGGGGACATIPAASPAGTALYRFPVTRAFTLLGSPTVLAKLALTGVNAQVAAHLVDIAPNGREILVARTLYRPDRTTGRQVFQLHPNGWRFAPGHTIGLALLGRDATYGRGSNGAFTVGVSRLELRLPVQERPGAAGGVVRKPAAVVLPAGWRRAPGVPR